MKENSLSRFIKSTIWIYALICAIAVGFLSALIVLSIFDSVSLNAPTKIENLYYAISILSGVATVGVLICTIIAFKKDDTSRALDIETIDIRNDNEEIKNILHKPHLERYDYDNICTILNGFKNDYKNIKRFSPETHTRYTTKLYNELNAFFSSVKLIDLIGVDSRRRYRDCIDSIIKHFEEMELNSEKYDFFIELKKNKKSSIFFNECNANSLLQILAFIDSDSISLFNPIENITDILEKEIFSTPIQKGSMLHPIFPELYAIVAIAKFFYAVVNRDGKIEIFPKNMMMATVNEKIIN